MRERIKEWTTDVSDTGEPVASIHIYELDERLRDPALWEAGMVDCLRAADLVVTEQKLPYMVAVGLPLAAPLNQETPVEISIASFVALRSYTPPMLCVFRAGLEPWKTVVQAYGGDCQQFSHPSLELYACRWWDVDENECVGGMWMRPIGRDL